MGNFSTGFCVGLGLTLLFTPMKGEEMRRLVGERIRSLRGTPPENQRLSQSISQMGVRLQEVPTRAEQARQMGTTTPATPTPGPVRETPSSTGAVQRDLNRVTPQTGSTTPSTTQETPSSAGEAQQKFNRAAQQADLTPPSTAQETPSSSTEEAQREINRAAQQMGATPPAAGPVRETPSSTEEVQQELNQAMQQMGSTTSDAVQETPSSVEEGQRDLNRATRQAGTGNPPPPRRPRSQGGP